MDLVSHVHVPAVNVQPYTPSEDPSDCAGHAAAVSCQRSSDTGKMTALEVLEIRWVRSLRSPRRGVGYFLA